MDCEIMQKLRREKQLWELYTRREEYDPPALDKHKRFSHALSENKNIFEPTVSEYLMENGLRPQYPENKDFAVCLTHDVDVIYPPRLYSAKIMLKSLFRPDLKDSFRYACCAADKKHTPLKNFREIRRLEEKYGAKSTFFFLAPEKTSLDSNYVIDELREELREIRAAGWGIGLHGGYDSYNNLDAITNEKERLENALGEKVVGYRNHFLRFKVPGTWENLSRAGFKYDSTLGYADMPGFRNGMCHPHKPFNLETNKEIDITEIPLTIMDGTFFDYMKLGCGEAWQLTKKLMDKTAKLKGVITILWHNTHMTGERLKLYEKILSYGKERNAWMTSGEEIVKNLEAQ